MGRLRSRILRTLASFPTAASAPANLLLRHAAPSPPAPPRQQQEPHAPKPRSISAPSDSDSDKENTRPERAPPQQQHEQHSRKPHSISDSDSDKENTRPERAPPRQQHEQHSRKPHSISDSDPDKENTRPERAPPQQQHEQHSRKPHSISDSDSDSAKENTRQPRRSPEGYRRPALSSPTLFDPDLLLAFHRAVAAHRRGLQEADQGGGDEPPAKVARTGEADPFAGLERRCPPGGGVGEADPFAGLERSCPPGGGAGEADPFAGLERRCPPGGGGAAVLYTTTLRGVRKTFEDCNRVRLLLASLRVGFLERDVSMDAGYRDEMWRVLGRRAVPPRLFVCGRYVGGADEAVALHEQGRLRPMLRHLPARVAGPCAGCGGAGFAVCGPCRGSHRLYDAGGGGERLPCSGCNENGLVPCRLCS